MLSTSCLVAFQILLPFFCKKKNFTMVRGGGALRGEKRRAIDGTEVSQAIYVLNDGL
jgi:hypothetical protein